MATQQEVQEFFEQDFFYLQDWLCEFEDERAFFSFEVLINNLNSPFKIYCYETNDGIGYFQHVEDITIDQLIQSFGQSGLRYNVACEDNNVTVRAYERVLYRWYEEWRNNNNNALLFTFH